MKQMIVPDAVSPNYIPEDLQFTFKLGLPLVEVEVEVCLWELGGKQAFSPVPITKNVV